MDPVNQLLIVAGNTATFSVTAMGKSLTYQWQFDGSDISSGTKYSGANTTTLMVNNVDGNDEGNYQVIVSNAAGGMTSTPARLTLCKWYNVTGVQNVC